MVYEPGYPCHRPNPRCCWDFLPFPYGDEDRLDALALARRPLRRVSSRSVLESSTLPERLDLGSGLFTGVLVDGEQLLERAGAAKRKQPPRSGSTSDGERPPASLHIDTRGSSVTASAVTALTYATRQTRTLS